MAKSQEERIKDAAEVLEKALKVELITPYEAVASQMLDAADQEGPSWPNDDVVTSYRNLCGFNALLPGTVNFEKSREVLRKVMIQDPVIKAAIQYENCYGYNRTGIDPGASLSRAVQEAGLSQR